MWQALNTLLLNPSNNSKRLVFLFPFFTGMAWTCQRSWWWFLSQCLTTVDTHTCTQGMVQVQRLLQATFPQTRLWDENLAISLVTAAGLHTNARVKKGEAVGEADCSAVTAEAPADPTGPTELSWSGPRPLCPQVDQPLNGGCCPRGDGQALEWGSSP